MSRRGRVPLKAVLRIAGAVVEITLDVSEELCDALDRDGPGGRKITAEEGMELGLAFAQAFVAQRGAGDLDAARVADMIEQARDLFRREPEA